MNWPHLHLIINHLPIVGLPISLAVLAAGLWRRSRDLTRAGLLLLALLGAGSPLVKLSGDQAEEAVEEAAWFNESIAEDHEEAAERATIAAAALAVVALYGLWRSRKNQPVPTGAGYAALGWGVVVAALMGMAGLTGGAIRHDELGRSAVAAPREEDER